MHSNGCCRWYHLQSMNRVWSFMIDMRIFSGGWIKCARCTLIEHFESLSNIIFDWKLRHADAINLMINKKKMQTIRYYNRETKKMIHVYNKTIDSLMSSWRKKEIPDSNNILCLFHTTIVWNITRFCVEMTTHVKNQCFLFLTHRNGQTA